MKKIKTFLTILFSCSFFLLKADLLEEARLAVVGGQYAQAMELLGRAVGANSALTNNAQYLYLSGVCEFEEGNFQEAHKLLASAKNKGNGLANLYLGKIAFMEYDFDEASEAYSQFRKYKEKQKQMAGEEVELLEKSLEIAENSLGRVEKIVIIDSISINKKDFLEAISTPPSAGKLYDSSVLPSNFQRKGVETVYMNENEDYMIWGAPDEIGNRCLMESDRYIGEGWSAPKALPQTLNIGKNESFPFLLGDGQTLYFASDGEDSMGGYDIFVAQREGVSGDFLQPMNVGMPYNSPFDDYMMVIDEENGIGWWATDRNRLGEKITIYVYLLNELRTNYEWDDENLINYARIKDYRSTQPAGKENEYSNLLNDLKKYLNQADKDKNFFNFPLGNGMIYQRISDFKQPAAAKAMNLYLNAENNYNKDLQELRDLQKRYVSGKADNIKDKIIELEKSIEKQRTDLLSKKNEIIKIERKLK